MRDATAKFLLPAIFFLISLLTPSTIFAAETSSVDFSPPPPPRLGAFAGSSGGALIVAGGVSASGKSPTDTIFILPSASATSWQQEDKLDEPIAWGASATVNDSLICIGGFDGANCSTHVFRLRYINGKLVEDHLPNLPFASAWCGAGAVGQTLYVVGGISNPQTGEARKDVLQIDLSSQSPAWQTLDPLSGPGRVQPMVVGQYNMLEIFGGRTGNAATGFKTLADSYTFRPHPWDGTIQVGWVKIANIAKPLAAGCAIAVGEAHTLIVGAD